MEFERKETNSYLKVIGVGGCGCNVADYIFKQNIDNVDFIACNTDIRSLESTQINNKIQLGVELTKGFGSGSNPEKARTATIESIEEIERYLINETKMVFIIAGLGGGTGTGGASVIAEYAKKHKIISVGLVTIPSKIEGLRKQKMAEEGLKELRKHIDAILVIDNNKLREQFGDKSLSVLYNDANQIFTTSVRGISNLVSKNRIVNVDFEDIRSVIKDGGVAIIGSCTADGSDKLLKAAEGALNSPVLSNIEIKEAKSLLINIEFGNEEPSIDAYDEAYEIIKSKTNFVEDSFIISGYGKDDKLKDEVTVTVIATGLTEKDKKYLNPKKINLEENVESEEKFKENMNGLIEFNFDSNEKKQPIIVKKNEKEQIEKDNFKEHKILFTEDNENSTFDPENYEDSMSLPAYKRRNVEIEKHYNSKDSQSSKHIMTELEDEEGNKKIEYKKENSFLNDNAC